MRTLARRSGSSLLLAFAVVAASCGGSDNAETPPENAEPPATEAPVTEAPFETDPPATEPAPTEPPATEPRPTDAPVETEAPYDDIEWTDGFGPYNVGVQTIVIPDETGGDRDLTVDVWFPLADSVEGALQRYAFLPDVYYESPRAIARNSVDISPDGPFPLVVYSHGSGGQRYIHSNYTEAIASHGYIVAAPDHTGNTALEDITDTRDDPLAIPLNRPRDVSAVIDAMLNAESTATVGFVANVNPGQIAVTGHSFGGFTSYAVASGFDNELGEYVADERVSALIALAPAAGERLLSDERLMSIDVPALVMVGTDDKTTPSDPNVDRPWQLTMSSPSYRVDLVAAEHQTFTDVCLYIDSVFTLPDIPQPIVDAIEVSAEEGCAEGDMPIERAHQIINTFATSFLDSIFRGTPMIDLLDVDQQGDLLYEVR